jgi:hypothetical protein
MREMSNLVRIVSMFAMAAAAVVASLTGSSAAGAPQPPETPADIQVEVAPVAVAAGESASVTVRLQPIEGVRINRYPRIRLRLEAADGISSAAETSVGNDSPPAPDKMEANYFDQVDPLSLDVVTLGGAPSGKHALSADLTYFYCVKASGFCAPKKTTVRIPLTIR